MNKAMIKITAILSVTSILFFSVGCASSDQSAPNASLDNKSAASTSTSSKQETPKAPSTISVEMELSSGNYTVGVDFPEGKYDIEAIAGGGNVMSSNAFNGGINAVMGVAEKNTDGLNMYEQTYSNIKLPESTTLTISGGVKVKVSSKAASGAPLKKREQPNTETFDIGNGNFIADEDFPAGVYDIVAVSGGGNVMSDNMMSGGINAVMGDAGQGQSMGIDMYEQQYKNVELPAGTTLTVSGVQIQLIPSK